MLPTSCKPDKSAVSSIRTPQAPPFPPLRVVVGWTPQETGYPRSDSPPQAGQLLLHLPLCPLLSHREAPSPHPHRLTFPCISIRSVRVMLSSGSSSSPASEPLILSGGAGAEAAWECVHTVAWPALRGQWERVREELHSLSGPLPLHGNPKAKLHKLPEQGDSVDHKFQVSH